MSTPSPALSTTPSVADLRRDATAFLLDARRSPVDVVLSAHASAMHAPAPSELARRRDAFMGDVVRLNEMVDTWTARRTVDAVQVHHDLAAARAELRLTRATEHGWWTDEDLPLVSAPKVGLHGWWHVAGSCAYLVVPDSANEHESLVYVMEWHEDGFAQCYPFYVRLRADGESWAASIEGLARSVSAVEAARWFDRETMEHVIEECVKAVALVLTASTLAQVVPGAVERSSVPAKVARKRAKRGGWVGAAEAVRLMLPGLRYEPAGRRWSILGHDGVRHHFVRGHWRTLRSERYGSNRGKRVWVSPHERGSAAKGAVLGGAYEVGAVAS